MGGQVSYTGNGVSATLSILQVAGAFALVIIAVVVLIVAWAFFCDKANVKSFSFRNGFTFYADGETKKKRFYHKTAPVAKRRPRNAK